MLKLSNRSIHISLVFVVFFLLSFQPGCKKSNGEEITADFSIEYTDDNHVTYQNLSTGDYYSITWDFGNGQKETTTDKKKVYTIYYPIAGSYDVSLQVNGYTGEKKVASKQVSIAANDIEVTFEMSVDPENPNYVNLKNTTQGEYDTYRWLYRDVEVENEAEIQAYFPLAGVYQVELEVTKNNVIMSAKKSVTIDQDDPDYTGLIWSDEFNYTGLPDPSYWNMETGGHGWGNNELQYYTDRDDNAVVGDGVLTITAKKESLGGRDYTSARITTQNKFDFQYGRIEARIKLPYGQGIWPAFWMLGANFSSDGWPACGEIDIMELVGGTGKDQTVYCTLHWEHDGGHASYGENYSLTSGIFADDFHVFSVEWNAVEIKGYVDDIRYFVADITPQQMSEFHNSFFILLNVAVGGNWPGSPDESTIFPQTMEVDYVRVYKQ